MKNVLYYIVIAIASLFIRQSLFAQTEGRGKPIYSAYTGLVMAGYQGWFAAEGDDSHRGWYHYRGRGGAFEPGVSSVDFWPDMREYKKSTNRRLSLRMAAMHTYTAPMTKKV